MRPRRSTSAACSHGAGLPSELPAAMDELHARYGIPPARLRHARLPSAGHRLQIARHSGSRAGVVIAAHESRRPGPKPGDEHHAREIKASRRDMSVLPVDQPSTLTVIEKVARSRVSMSENERTLAVESLRRPATASQAPKP